MLLTEEQQKLVLKYQAFAISMTRFTRNKYPYLREDIVSAAYLALCYAVISYENKDRDIKLITYIGHQIKWCLIDFIDKETKLYGFRRMKNYDKHTLISLDSDVAVESVTDFPQAKLEVEELKSKCLSKLPIKYKDLFEPILDGKKTLADVVRDSSQAPSGIYNWFRVVKNTVNEELEILCR